MKFNNLKITSKLLTLVSVTIVGLCVAGVLAAYVVKREMLAERTEQLKAMIEVGRNAALSLQKQVESGQLTKEAAIAEFVRRIEPMTYDNGTGYIFIYNMDGIVVYLPGFKPGTNRLEVLVNGRPVTRELRDTVAKDGQSTLAV
jgi:methyl-accepting chemotaxis protein